MRGSWDAIASGAQGRCAWPYNQSLIYAQSHIDDRAHAHVLTLTHALECLIRGVCMKPQAKCMANKEETDRISFPGLGPGLRARWTGPHPFSPLRSQSCDVRARTRMRADTHTHTTHIIRNRHVLGLQGAGG
jgi:hypothetical protein